MSVSTKGFCENVLTLKAASGLEAGVPVAVSANDTVSAAGADAKFCGVSVNVSGGYAALASDGAGGVKASTKGNTYLVLSVNTTAKTVSFML